MYPFLLSSKNRQQVQAVPHPELTPLTRDECEAPNFRRDPMLSDRDYSPAQIQQAQAVGKLTMDMMEYCHNNGIAWEKSQRRGMRKVAR